jgi:uncharacterized delta-60 repeat protein
MLNFHFKKPIFVLSFFCLMSLTFADSPGSLDKTFNKTGMVKDSLPQLHETVKDVAVQSDGKIIVVGTTRIGNGTDAFLARYTSDGKLDSSFNGKGYMVKEYDFIDYLTAVKLQRNGKIVVAGNLYDSEGAQARLIVCRYNSNGTLDTSFNGKGYTIFSDHTEDTAFGVEIDASGRIITAGYAMINDQLHILICRFLSNGTLDTSFAGNGYYVSETTYDAAYALALQHDGKIIAAGAAYSDDKKSWVLALFAFLQNGKPDTSFNKGGRLIIPVPESSFYSLAVQQNGNIIGGGYFTSVDEEDYFDHLDLIILQINKNGILDSDFSIHWATNLSFINWEDNNMVVTDVAVAPDGKIVFCGYQYGFNESSYDIFVCRYTSDGNLDHNFGEDGYLVYDFGKTYEIDAHLAITSNGSIIVAGNTSKAYNQYYNEDLFLLKLRP